MARKCGLDDHVEIDDDDNNGNDDSDYNVVAKGSFQMQYKKNIIIRTFIVFIT